MSVQTIDPFLWNSTRVTPLLSDALACTVMFVLRGTLLPFDGEVMFTVGFVVSADGVGVGGAGVLVGVGGTGVLVGCTGVAVGVIGEGGRVVWGSGGADGRARAVCAWPLMVCWLRKR